jgi:predicted kinase
MSKLIVICGLPGSGKTTLAAALSSKLNIVCIHKDSIKESLYDDLGFKTLEESKKLGLPSVNLLLEIAEEQISRGVDVIIESPFAIADDYPRLQELIAKYTVDCYTIVCTISGSERKLRFVTRPRHSAHHDAERVKASDIAFNENHEVYKSIPGHQIWVTTDTDVAGLVSKVVGEMDRQEEALKASFSR